MMETINPSDMSKTKGLIEICTPRGSGGSLQPQQRKIFDSLQAVIAVYELENVGKTGMEYK